MSDAYYKEIEKQAAIYTARLEGRTSGYNCDADTTTEIVSTTFSVERPLLEAVEALAAHQNIDRDKLMRYLLMTALEMLGDGKKRLEIAQSEAIKPGKAYRRGT
jgi:Flp pilus assembly protein TadD